MGRWHYGACWILFFIGLYWTSKTFKSVQFKMMFKPVWLKRPFVCEVRVQNVFFKAPILSPFLDISGLLAYKFNSKSSVVHCLPIYCSMLPHHSIPLPHWTHYYIILLLYNIRVVSFVSLRDRVRNSSNKNRLSLRTFEGSRRTIDEF